MSSAESGPLVDLITWVNTFHSSTCVSSPEKLSDGVTIANILHVVSPDHFPTSWKSKIQLNCDRIPRLRTANLNVIINGIIQFFNRVIEQPLDPTQLPDVELIATCYDGNELFRLLQLVLCCAVNCANKETYIQEILGMEESVQRTVMEAIQNVMNGQLLSTHKGNDSGDQMVEHDTFAQNVCELQAMVDGLKSEKTNLEMEMEDLRHRLMAWEKSVDTRAAGVPIDVDPLSTMSPVAITAPGSVAVHLQLRKLQDQLAAARDALYHSEADHQETKLRLIEAEKIAADLKKYNEVLVKQAEETTHLKDELDIVRDELQSAQRIVSSVEQWKTRAEETGNLRVLCTKLETDNGACLVRVAELEQELRLQTTLRQQAESNRQMTVEANARVSDLISRAEKAEAGLDKAEADLQAVIREKQILTNEFNRLKQCYEASSQVARMPSPTISFESMDVVGGQCSLKKGLDASTLADPMESKMKIDSATCGFYTAHASVTSDSGPEKLSATSPSMVPESSFLNSDKNEEVANVIAEKDAEIFKLEQRYRGYLVKAMELIRELDRRNAVGEESKNVADPNQSDAEIARLQSLLVEKENIIEQIKFHHEQVGRQRDLEEVMTLSAWYHFGMQRQRTGMENRLMHTAGISIGANCRNATNEDVLSNESFLARQRRLQLKSSPPERPAASVLSTYQKS